MRDEGRKGDEDQRSVEQVRRMLLRVMLEKVHEDQFPSNTQLDIIERLLTPREEPLYAEVLLSKISEDTYPSLDLVRRLVKATETA